MFDLRAEIARLSLTQRGAGRALGVHERTIRKWLSGEREIPSAVPALIRAAFELSAYTGEAPAVILARLQESSEK